MSRFLIFCLNIAVCTSISLHSSQSDNGKEPDIPEFLNEYYSSQEKRENGYSKLLYAMTRNYRTIALKLLSCGANPNEYPQKGPRLVPLFLAISLEDIEFVKLLLDKGAEFTCGDLILKDAEPVKEIYPEQVAIITNKNDDIFKLLLNRKNAIDCSINPVLKDVLKKSDFDKFKLICEFINDKSKNVYNVDPHRYIAFSLRNLQFPSSAQEKDNQYNILYCVAQNIPLENNDYSLLNLAIRLGNQQAVKVLGKNWGRRTNWPANALIF
jgi:ankyrin repeat protein